MIYDREVSCWRVALMPAPRKWPPLLSWEGILTFGDHEFTWITQVQPTNQQDRACRIELADSGLNFSRKIGLVTGIRPKLPQKVYRDNWLGAQTPIHRSPNNSQPSSHWLLLKVTIHNPHPTWFLQNLLKSVLTLQLTSGFMRVY